MTKEEQAADRLDFQVGDNAAGALLSYIQRIERLDEEMSALKEDRSEVFAEAKSDGFDTAIMRKVLSARKDPKAWEETQTLIQTYMDALKKQGAGK